MGSGGGRATQRALGTIARVVLPARAPFETLDLRQLRRVLVVRTDDRVGNVLLTTPLMRALREGLPHVRLDWLLASRRAGLIDGLGLADALVPYDKRRAARNPLAFASLMWRLRRAKYDLVIDAAHWHTFSSTAALLTRATGAPIRIGHERGEAARFYSHPVPLPDDTTYDVAVKLSLLAPLGLPARGFELETSAGLADADRDTADRTLSDRGLAPGGFIVVNPGARLEERRFSPERLGELMRRLDEALSLRSLVVWGPGEEGIARAAVQASGGAGVLAPPTDLNHLAALLRRAALLVTNDTGPMHLGVACGTPTVALFMRSDPARWGHPLPTFRAVDASEAADDPLAEAEAAARALMKRLAP